MTKDELLRELETVLLLNPGTIKESDTLDDLGVDSTGMLELVALLTIKLEMKIDVNAIVEIKTVGDIVKLAAEKIG